MDKQKQQLDLLISSQETQEKQGNLTEVGKSYLNGLHAARKIVFGEPNIKTRKIKKVKTKK